MSLCKSGVTDRGSMVWCSPQDRQALDLGRTHCLGRAH